jgi:CelD/BcsL family acetyltransferase involved in cellulose biosynthesis
MSRGDRSETAIISSRREIEALAHEWDTLAASTGLPMLSHAWVLSCAESLYTEDQLQIITVRAGGVLAGVAPLVARQAAGITRLELIGSSHLFEPSGFLYDTDSTLDVLARAIVNTRRPIVLARIPTDSPIGARLQSAARGRGVTFVKPGADTLAVPISCGWNEYLASMSSRQRYDLKRARRRAEESGTVAVRILSPRPEDVAGMFDELVRVESSGWKARNGSSLTHRQHLRHFFLNYATRASQSGVTRFAFLDVNDRPIAAQLMVEYSERLWILKIGYDEAWSRCSPGWLLIAETMRYAFERNLKSYEFLGSDEPWLHRWDTDDRRCSTVIGYPFTLRGLYGFAADTAGRVRTKVASYSNR